jgi:hypothetical protein
MERQFVRAVLQSDEFGARDFGEPSSARLLLSQNHVPIDNFTWPGVAHAMQSYLDPKLTPQLDFDIADVTGTIDAPSHRGEVPSRQDCEHEKRQRGERLAERASQGKHPWLPVFGAQRLKRAGDIGESGSIRTVKIDELQILLN